MEHAKNIMSSTLSKWLCVDFIEYTTMLYYEDRRTNESKKKKNNLRKINSGKLEGSGWLHTNADSPNRTSGTPTELSDYSSVGYSYKDNPEVERRKTQLSISGRQFFANLSSEVDSKFLLKEG